MNGQFSLVFDFPTGISASAVKCGAEACVGKGIPRKKLLIIVHL